MKKVTGIFCLLLLIATSLFAVEDPRPDMMGMYWDLDADIPCMAPLAAPVNLHIILTNPSMDAISGFEFGFTMDAAVAPYILSATIATPQAEDLASGFQNFIVGLGAPATCTEATLLVTLSIGNFAGVPVDFYLHQASPPSIPGNLPVILLTDGTLVQVNTPNPGGVIAAQNVDCIPPSPIHETTWDHVKSLYR